MIRKTISLTLALSMIACSYTVRHIQVTGIQIRSAGLMENNEPLIIQKSQILAAKVIKKGKALRITYPWNTVMLITYSSKIYLDLIKEHRGRGVHLTFKKDFRAVVQFLSDIIVRKEHPIIQNKEHP